LKQDSALAHRNRGTRKLIVTKIRDGKEKKAINDTWSPPAPGQECPVLQMSNAEMGIFNEGANQDRHYHKEGTEIYEVIEGEVVLEVEGKIYRLNQGDSIVVFPFSIHEVKRENSKFLCRVITLNSRGEKDKYCV
jgi:quercetin dioxygenase-like cupin family protein